MKYKAIVVGVIGMTRYMLPVFLVALVALILGAAALELRANDEEEEFDEFEVFIEINATDGDAGLQIKVDGKAWKKLKIKDARGKTALEIKLKGAMSKQGLTEYQSESAEPPFTVAPLADFLARFPAGTWEAKAKTTEGGKLESETELTHDLPAGPANIVLVEDNDIDIVTVTWDQVKDDFRRPGAEDLASDIVGYEVVAECEDAEGELVKVVKRDVPGDPEEPETTLPADIFDDINLVCKIEVLAMEASGNLTATEMEVDL